MSFLETSPGSVVMSEEPMRIFIRRRGPRRDTDGEEPIQVCALDRPTAAPPARGRSLRTSYDGDGQSRCEPKPLFPSQDEIGRLRSTYLAARLKRLQSLTLEGKLMADREGRVIARHEAMSQEWEKFRTLAGKVTRRELGELAITRAEEHRERIELFDLLDMVTPLVEKSGEDSWYHSLRDGGVKFSQVGNMFSGLYVPSRLSKTRQDSEIIRKPWLKDCFTSLKNKSTKTWRDDQYLRDRLTRFRLPMTEAAPGVLNLDDTLEILGIQERSVVEEAGERTEGGSKDSHTAGHSDVAGMKTSGETDDVACMGVGTAEEGGPSVCLSASRVFFTTFVTGTQTDSREIEITNNGSTVINFSFAQDASLDREALITNVALYTQSPFSCHQCRGTLLPGDSLKLAVTFNAPTVGYFRDSWAITTQPETTQLMVALEGLCATHSTLLATEEIISTLEETLVRNSILGAMRELIDEIVDSSSSVTLHKDLT